MAVESAAFFIDCFFGLTDRSPYPWQKKLFLRFIAPPAQSWPEVVDLPTGAGKTSVLYVWLLALAWSIRTGALGVPRRLAWIVNRRVVVDQITAELEALLRRVSEIAELRDLLASVSLSGKPLAASTLRGQLADNGDWSRDPSTPAVLVGTVDMIGSRLLFRGYRAGGYYRPMHAGLLGVDTLIVNDEAHLTPALAGLLIAVRDRKPAEQIPGKFFHIMLLSATSDALPGLQRFEHEPAEDAAESRDFYKVFNASKSLAFHEVTNLNELDAAIWSLATESPATRTAIFVEQPEKAAKLAERLRKEKKPCALLTGTMRGYERDRLTEDEIFRRFLDRESSGDPVWLVCTSAGEVGLNFSCERMITGLVEADHLLQRFGRLNRFGDSSPGEAYVVYRNPEKEERLRKTLIYLRELGGDISCAKLWDNPAPEDARSERPGEARLEDRHVDLWSQTTYRDRWVPAVASWLHGKQESEAPDAEVVWRSDVDTLTKWGVSGDQMRGVLEYYPVLAREKLSEPATRVAKKLAEIRARLGPAEASKTKVILVESDGSPSVWDLASLVKQTEKDSGYLDYKLLLLPDGLGSVTQGMFSSAGGDEVEIADVADVAIKADVYPERIRFFFEEEERATRVPTKEALSQTPAPVSLRRSDLEQYAPTKYRPPLIIEDPKGEDGYLVYFAAHTTFRRAAANAGLSQHQSNVGAKAKALAFRVHLAEWGEIYEKAGRVHDQGKYRRVWQFAMGGTMEKPLAKTKKPLNVRLIDGYRHELGSLIDALAAPNGETDDLLLHLIASHHAAGRPYFETRQYDPENLTRSAAESAEVARRYARLQARFGAWGLAYLEAVFKCADGIVSSEEGDAASA